MIVLYKNHGSAIGYWQGHANALGEVVMIHSKKLDGKPVEKRYQAVPKNVGRANETTAVEQAQLELESRVRKQMDKGYVRTIAEAEAPVTNALALPLPMLAKPLDKVKSEKIDWENAFVQPKLDGHRALFKDGQMYSRQGKPLHFPHIHEAIHEMKLDHLHLDGELYLHGVPLQDLSRMIKKPLAGDTRLQYHIYDVVTDAPFEERYELLDERNTLHPTIKIVPASYVTSMDQLQYEHGYYRAAGYEGTMLRHGRDPYQTGKRSSGLLKVKEFHDAEFKIVGYTEGKPYITAQGTFQVPVWDCVAANGKHFNVTAAGDMAEKHVQWVSRDELVGRMLTVKYHYLSKDGIPQLPIALRFYETV